MVSDYYQLDLEVPAELGPNTRFDKSVIPWKFEHVHLVFQTIPSGHLFKVSPNFFASLELHNRIISEKISGIIGFEPIEISYSEEFILRSKARIAREYVKLIISAIKTTDIFILNNKIMVNKKSLSVLQGFLAEDTGITLIETN